MIPALVFYLRVWRGICIVDAFFISYPSPTRSVCEDTLVGECVIIPSTCIRERDIVIAPLVRVSVCLSVCVSVCVSPLNS